MTTLKESWQRQKQQRQQSTLDRQQQVYATITRFQQTRQTQAAQQRIELSAFHQQLHQQTRAQLATIATDRTILAQQLTLGLHNDRLSLSAAVSSFRQTLQEEVQLLQLETQTRLNDCQEARVYLKQRQAQELAAFVRQLQIQVQAQLTQLAADRQIIAQQLRRTLEQDRNRRQIEVEALFQQFAAFRTELQQYRASLSHLVWGVDSEEAIETPLPVVHKTPVISPSAIADPWSEPSKVEASTAKNESAPPSSEEETYCYLYQQQGACLTEVEAALNLSRFQIVDALRSLIKKGLVRQRDRMYYVQE